MPLPMVHLEVAQKIVEADFTINDLSYFYLGVISPDAIHMRQDSNRTAKNHTHLEFLVPSGKKWGEISDQDGYDFLLRFLASHKDKTNLSFLWGYIIHILTDMLWYKQVYHHFKVKYKEDLTPIQEERWAYYNDTDILDQVLFNECPWRDSVWQYLQKAEGFDFLALLSTHEIDLWNERTRHWYDSGESKHKNPIRYITKEEILQFISQCSASILNNIN